MRYSYVLILGAFLATTSFSPLLACNCGIKEGSSELVAEVSPDAVAAFQ